MERLKGEIPWKLRRKIEESSVDDLPSTCSSLHDFLAHSPLFHSMMDDLTNPQMGICGKNMEAALEFKSKGNASFSARDYLQALRFYSQALRVAPFDAADKDNKLVSILYVNRASSLHKLSLLEESLRDCKRAVTLDPKYAKAWYRRGKVNASLLNYEAAICDLKVAASMEGTESGKRKIEADMKLLIVNQNNSGSSFDKRSGSNRLIIDEEPQAKLKCEFTTTKGRGMASQFDVHPAYLVHREEPYAAIVLKHFRESHCHFCFNELPADPVPCMSCSIPLYCSEHCQRQAGGQVSRNSITEEIHDMLSTELERYFSEVTLESHLNTKVECFTEHGHECHGVNWPAVLPSDVVLAGRIFVKLVELKESSWDSENISKNLDLFHNYVQLPPDSKMELHVYAVVLLYCIRCSFSYGLGLNGAVIAKVVILISQIKVNSMAVVRMRNVDKFRPLNQSKTSSLPANAVTSDLEQVRVGQAIYLTGCLFNHSCLPNVHAYFVSRTLLIRATEFVAAGSSLELSYGPQVGQWDYGHRKAFLRCNYSFECQCVACTRVNFPDLVLHAFRCAKPNCLGVVLDHDTAEFERHKVYLQNAPGVDSLELQREVDELNNDEIKELAHLVFKQNNFPHEIQAGYCLNCGSAYDLKSLHATAGEAEVCIKSLTTAEDSKQFCTGAISKALSSLQVLESALHPYNKKLAEAEDTLAEALCSVGEMQHAIYHCRASIEILKKIYHPGHIVVGNELLKLSSIQLALGETGVVETIWQMDAIFSKYYGRHAEVMFPYLQHLKAQVCQIVAEGPS